MSSVKKIIPGFRILTLRGRKGKRQNPQSCGVAIRHLQVSLSSENAVFAEQSWVFMKYNHYRSDQNSTRRFFPLLILLMTLVLGLGNAFVGTGSRTRLQYPAYPLLFLLPSGLGFRGHSG